MSVHTYIGARYVPKFWGTYDPTQQYEALDVVDNGSGTSYIAKKIVPAGTPLTDTSCWAIYGAASGAIISLQDQINDIVAVLDGVYATVADLATADLPAGAVVHTAGYYNAGDGGAADYIIKNSTSRINVPLNNGKYAELIYDDTINVKQVGAVGNGVTDDTLYFQQALSEGVHIVIPTGRYLVTDDIELSDYQSLCANDQINTRIEVGAHSIILAGRFTKVKGLTVVGDGTNTGVQIGKAGNDYANLTIADMIITNTNAGIKSEGTMTFLIDISNVRVTNSAYGINLINTFNVKLDRVYPNAPSTQALRFENCINAVVINSNIGFGANTKIGISSNSNVEFINCHFECDAPTSGYLINIVSTRVMFSNCDFFVNGDATAYIIAIGNSASSIYFINCRYDRASASIGSFPVVDANTFAPTTLGALNFGPGTASFPRPTGLLTSQNCKWIDTCKFGALGFSSTEIDRSQLTRGSVVFYRNDNKLGVYNGTNIVDMNGNIIY